MENRNGDWMQTYTGLRFWPLDPRVEDISLNDIAHSLSMQCRYGGHSLRFYSVAEHSVLVAQACSIENALWGLLHDASEAYLVDVPRPLKRSLPGYKEAEDRVMRCVAEKFNLSWPMPDEVKMIDERILGNERRAVMREGPSWHLPYEPLKGIEFFFWRPEKVKERFLELFDVI